MGRFTKHIGARLEIPSFPFSNYSLIKKTVNKNISTYLRITSVIKYSLFVHYICGHHCRLWTSDDAASNHSPSTPAHTGLLLEYPQYSASMLGFLTFPAHRFQHQLTVSTSKQKSKLNRETSSRTTHLACSNVNHTERNPSRLKAVARTSTARLSRREFALACSAAAYGLLFMREANPVEAMADEIKSVYDISVEKDGKPFSLSTFSGKVTLFTNVASYCGLTPQYKGLVRLHDTYQKDGFEIVAAPCNQFGRQEPGTNEEICSRVKDTFGVNFFLTDKLVVNESKNGQDGNVSPLYRYLRDNAPEKKGAPIAWNFEKFLVNKDGQILRRYSPGVNPEDLEDDVRFALSHPAQGLPPRTKGYLGV